MAVESLKAFLTCAFKGLNVLTQLQAKELWAANRNRPSKATEMNVTFLMQRILSAFIGTTMLLR